MPWRSIKVYMLSGKAVELGLHLKSGSSVWRLYSYKGHFVFVNCLTNKYLGDQAHFLKDSVRILRCHQFIHTT